MIRKGIKAHFGIVLVFAIVAMNVLAMKAGHSAGDWSQGDGPEAPRRGPNGES